MAEYIERDALLADLADAMDHRGMGQIVGEALMRYVKRQPAADVTPAMRWIPVTERLPEDPVKKVLIFVPHTHGNIVDVGRYLGADGWVLEGWYLTQTSVTHWAPLPEPPEVENAETE